MKHPIGTRIRFPREITGISETQGPVVFARAGEKGEIMEYGEIFPYSVKVDSWHNAFGAAGEDFEVIDEAAQAAGKEEGS